MATGDHRTSSSRTAGLAACSNARLGSTAGSAGVHCVSRSLAAMQLYPANTVVVVFAGSANPMVT
jgi:hypothetical protein